MDPLFVLNYLIIFIQKFIVCSDSGTKTENIDLGNFATIFFLFFYLCGPHRSLTQFYKRRIDQFMKTHFLWTQEILKWCGFNPHPGMIISA